jgi:hypothetical protein
MMKEKKPGLAEVVSIAVGTMIGASFLWYTCSYCRCNISRIIFQKDQSQSI